MKQYLRNVTTGEAWPIEEFFGKGKFIIVDDVQQKSNVVEFVNNYLVSSRHSAIHTDELYAYYVHLNRSDAVSRVNFARELRLEMAKLGAVKTAPQIKGRRVQGFRGVRVSQELMSRLLSDVEKEKVKLGAVYADSNRVLDELVKRKGESSLTDIILGVK